MISAIIPAAGTGSRFGAEMPKQYVPLAGKPVLQHTLDRLAGHPRIGRIAVVVSAEDALFDRLIRLPPRAAVYRVGGQSRAETVFNGLSCLLQRQEIAAEDTVLVHDAARCCLPPEALERLIARAADHPAGGLLALPVADTLKRQDSDAQTAAATVPRTGLWQAQTPQLFQAALLHRALAAADRAAVTDEAGAVEALGLHPLLVPGDPRNIKLTRPEDAQLAEWFLSR